MLKVYIIKNNKTVLKSKTTLQEKLIRILSGAFRMK